MLDKPTINGRGIAVASGSFEVFGGERREIPTGCDFGLILCLSMGS
jgi:hypothetical protein